MKLFLPLLVVIVVGAGGWYILSYSKSGPPQNTSGTSFKDSSVESSVSPTVVDYSAGFAIFTNGTFRIFTAAMYHNLSEDIYIQADNPNIVRIKKANTTWDDFFKTLPFKLTKGCLTTGTGQLFCSDNNQKLKFYLNGNLDPDALNRVINPGDQLLVTYGSESDAEIEKQLRQVPTAD